jgi:hypothetical protein
LSDLMKTVVLGTLSPETTNLSIRIPIEAEFPSETAPRGKKSWFYLDALRPGQRYEVRVCWLATVSQPSRLGYSYRPMHPANFSSSNRPPSVSQLIQFPKFSIRHHYSLLWRLLPPKMRLN